MTAIYTLSILLVLLSVFGAGYYRAKHLYQPDEERRIQKFTRLRKQVKQRWEDDRISDEEFLREIYEQ